MLDSYIRPLIDPPLHKIAAFFKNGPLHANIVTITGFFFGVMACIAAANHLYFAALFLLIFNRLCDGLDGAVARIRNESSDFGGYLDITLDFFIYAGFPFSFAMGLGTIEAMQAGAFVLFSIITTGVSFLAYAIIAAKRNMETSHQGKKSFYFSNGLMEGTETIIFLCLLCLLPQYFVILCCVFGGLCLLTTAMRIHMAYHVFK